MTDQHDPFDFVNPDGFRLADDNLKYGELDFDLPSVEATPNTRPRLHVSESKCLACE